jgi:hypothetical protein
LVRLRTQYRRMAALNHLIPFAVTPLYDRPERGCAQGGG